MIHFSWKVKKAKIGHLRLADFNPWGQRPKIFLLKCDSRFSINNLFHLQLDWNYCFSRSLKFLQCWFSVFFCFFDPFFKSILLLLELLMTVLLDLISLFAESLSTVLRWQSGSKSGLKNPLTVHLMVHFISPFQATSHRLIQVRSSVSFTGFRP